MCAETGDDSEGNSQYIMIILGDLSWAVISFPGDEGHKEHCGLMLETWVECQRSCAGWLRRCTNG